MSRGALLCALCGELLLAVEPALAQGLRGGADSVRVRVAGVDTLEGGSAMRGALVEIRLSLEHAKGFHTWPHDPVVPPQLAGLNPIATDVEVSSLPPGASLEGVAWPDPVLVTVRYAAEPIELLSYTGITTARVRLRLPVEGPSAGAEAVFTVRLQSCDERYCYPPRRVSLRARLGG